MDVRYPLPLDGGWTIGWDGAAILAREIGVGRPNVVVELGSGSSTVVIGIQLRESGRGHLYSLDHDPEFAESTRRHVAAFGLEPYVTVFDAPLEHQEVDGDTYRWYRLPDAVAALPRIDALVVDGPPQAMDRGGSPRYPAFPVLGTDSVRKRSSSSMTPGAKENCGCSSAGSRDVRTGDERTSPPGTAPRSCGASALRRRPSKRSPLLPRVRCASVGPVVQGAGHGHHGDALTGAPSPKPAARGPTGPRRWTVIARHRHGLVAEHGDDLPGSGQLIHGGCAMPGGRPAGRRSRCGSFGRCLPGRAPHRPQRRPTGAPRIPTEGRSRGDGQTRPRSRQTRPRRPGLGARSRHPPTSAAGRRCGSCATSPTTAGFSARPSPMTACAHRSSRSGSSRRTRTSTSRYARRRTTAHGAGRSAPRCARRDASAQSRTAGSSASARPTSSNGSARRIPRGSP